MTSTPAMSPSVSLLFCFAPPDQPLWDELNQHLEPLRRAEFINDFHPQAVCPGQEMEQEMCIRLEKARLIVLLVSSDFLASPICMAQAKRALQQQRNELAKVIVVLLRACLLDATELRDLPVLPAHDAPISACLDRDTAWCNVVRVLCATLQTGSMPSAEIMGTSLLLDNWTIHTAGKLLDEGCDPGTTHFLEPESTSPPHARLVSAAGVQFQALLSLLTDLILRERLVIEVDWSDTWVDRFRLQGLSGSGIIDLIDFRRTFVNLPKITKLMIPRVCTTEWMCRVQAQNERYFSEFCKTRYKFESAVMWGTAGYLARAHLADLTYSSHPIRRHVLVHGKPDANTMLTDWIREERLRLIEAVFPAGASRQLSLTVPPRIEPYQR